MPPRRLAADWVLPVAGPPIRNGAVLVGETGRIEAVGPAASLPVLPEEFFAGAVLIPGLVNAHTHLELTGYDGQVQDDEFPAWIGHLRAIKAERGPEDFLAAARRGLADCFAAGVTTIADTGDSGAVIRALHESNASGVAYLEVFGPHPADVERQLEEFRPRVEIAGAYATGRVRLGLSPHAPYSVSGRLYAAVARWARDEGLPTAVHIAESAAESDLLGTASGAFAEMWRSRGIPLPAMPGCSPIGWLENHGILGERTLCIHAVRVDTRDIDALTRHGAAIAHCPRSNQRHGHGAAPLTRLLSAGLRVGVGTDSVASVSPLDLLAEARAARVLGRLDASEALALCTLGAARAIGLDDQVGSLTVGKWADVAVLRLPGGVDEPRLADTVLSRGPGDVMATFVAGRAVFRSKEPLALGR